MLQFRKRLPDAHVHILPVIEPCAFQFAVVRRKTERFYEMESGACRKTKPSNVAGVRRNLWLDEYDVKHFWQQGADPRPPDGSASSLLQLPRDKLLKFHDVRSEFADAFRGLLRRHRVVIYHVAKRLFIELQAFRMCFLRFL